MLISDKKEENAVEKNLTTGSVFKNVILFSLPYLLSYFLQTLYGMADLFIIGQYDGVASTTAVSVGSQIMHMITVMIVGLAMGTTVSIAQAIGTDNKKQASKAVGNTIVLFMGVAIVGMALLLMLVHPIVSVMSTPAEAVIVLVRIPGVYLTSRLFKTTLLPMGLATAAGSLLSVFICVIAFYVIYHKKPIMKDHHFFGYH